MARKTSGTTMSDQNESPTDEFYKLQYRIVFIDRNQNQVDVAFHRPGKAGFSSLEVAKVALDAILKADAELQESRVYEIQPVLVSEMYQQFVENVVIHDGSEDDIAPDMSFPPIPEGGSNTAN